MRATDTHVTHPVVHVLTSLCVGTLVSPTKTVESIEVSVYRSEQTVVSASNRALDVRRSRPVGHSLSTRYTALLKWSV